MMKFLIICLFIIQGEIGHLCYCERIGILVHGYNRRADGWEEVVLGDASQGQLGRSSHAVAVILRYLSFKDDCVKCIFWGSGVYADEGLKEGEYTLKKQLERMADLVSFPEFSNLGTLALEKLRIYIEEVSVTDQQSINTKTEIENAFKLFEERNITHIILVSSATHAPRCLRDASVVLSEYSSKHWSPLILATPAYVCFPNTTPADVVIIEPPHLPTTKEMDQLINFNMLTKRCLKVTANKKALFMKDLDELLRSYSL